MTLLTFYVASYEPHFLRGGKGDFCWWKSRLLLFFTLQGLLSVMSVADHWLPPRKVIFLIKILVLFKFSLGV